MLYLEDSYTYVFGIQYVFLILFLSSHRLTVEF
uniref:Uncharacterized protein n=1 Tax=Arundo donax TaxID=35708 RepID=A0A0A9A0U8_ARUDO